MPPVVVGPVIMTIGLILAPNAVKMATSATEIYTQNEAMIVAATSLVATILVMMLGRGMLRLIPILLGIITGYTLAYAFGMVDFSPIANAPWLRMPNFTAPKFEPIAIIYMVPIAIAPAIEHIGDMLAISNVTKRFKIQRCLKTPF